MDHEITPDETTQGTPAPARSTPPTPPSGPRRTAEEWARAKGMLPEFHERENPRKRQHRRAKPVRIHNVDHAPFRAAKDSLRWPQGKELTEAEFDAAIAGVKTHVYR